MAAQNSRQRHSVLYASIILSIFHRARGQAYGPLRAAAQYTSLSVVPSSQLTEGMPMNLTCRFSQLLPDVVVLSMLSFTGRSNQLLASTNLTIGVSQALNSRVNAIVNDYYSIEFVFNYTLVADGGVYACGSINAVSNALAVTISAVSTTKPASTQVFNASMDTLTFAISVTVSLVCCFAALIVALVLRFRYGYRFRGSIYIRRSPRTNANASASASASASAQPSDDPEHLPTYANATSMVDKTYFPPSYDEAVRNQAQAENTQVNVHVQPPDSADYDMHIAVNTTFGSHDNPTYTPDGH